LSEIPKINIPVVSVPSIESWVIPNVPVPYAPIQKSLRFPVINAPCVLGRRDFTKNKQLYKDDPTGTYQSCSGGFPFYHPLEYNPKDIVIIETQEPNIAPPTENTAKAPDATPPPTKPVDEKETPCPDETKNNPRIGDIAANKTEKVSGFELSPDGKTCLVVYEPIGVVERYLPAPSTVTTTSVIASAAVISSVLAKPLADLLLKIIKPAIQKVVAKVLKLVGKSPPKLSSFEKRMKMRERNRAVRKLKRGW
jgi:hypothetical protein